ncbi:putative membrane protein [Geobacillus kaustophilus]|uniref:Putative membrane protein n=1 Tax=Geobacillus kaustophilus TaxID=1462 RepID=A0A0D8BPV0_GEOKU|nr:putative membrane protein [Geobacillus kaustophilus]
MKFYIPLYYMFYSRFKTKLNKISWFILIFFPTLSMTIYFSEVKSLYTYVSFLLATLAFFCVYEIGYIVNDTITIKKEKKPNMRITMSEVEYLRGNFWKIILSKVLISVISLIFLFLISRTFNVKIYTFQFFISLIGVSYFFYLHNTIRSRYNIFTFALLNIIKYYAFILLVVPFSKSLIPLLISIIFFPLVRTIEHSTKEKYNLIGMQRFVKNNDSFRVKYYALLFTVTLIILFINKYMTGRVNNLVWFCLITLGYFLTFRILVLIGLSYSKRLKSKYR